MGRLFEDGFDHYGTTIANMLDGTYAQVESGSPNDAGPPVLTAAQVATGSHSLLMQAGTGLSSWSGVRKVLPSPPYNKLGLTYRLYFSSLPTDSYDSCIAQFFTDSTASTHLSFFVDANGAIRILRAGDTFATSRTANNGVLLGITDPLIVAAAWNHIEIQAYIDNSAGWVRIAVNGVHRYELTGVDTRNGSTTGVYSIGQNLPYTNPVRSFYMDDYIIYDFTGTPATDTDFCPTYDGVTGIATGYIGELQVWPLFPNGDTSEADYAKSTGVTGYTLIGETDPNDATYIYSTTAGDLSEFDLEDLPPEITYIRGLTIHARLSKSDSGVAMHKSGMKSVAATTDDAERPVTVEPTYWRDMINVDPNSGARWTRASLNAAWLRLTRSV